MVAASSARPVAHGIGRGNAHDPSSWTSGIMMRVFPVFAAAIVADLMHVHSFHRAVGGCGGGRRLSGGNDMLVMVLVAGWRCLRPLGRSLM